MSVAANLETKIRQNRLLTLPVDWQDDVIFPYYEGLSLRNVPHSIAALLGVPLPDNTPLLDDVWQNQLPSADFDRIVVFLMDGMGYKHLKMLMAKDDSIQAAITDLNDGRDVIPLTSVAPSTTAVALPSLWTGGTPSQTAMLGTTMFLREFHTLADMLAFRPVIGKHFPDTFADWGMQSSDIIAMSGLSEHLAAHDIESHLVIARQLVGTGLSKVLHRGIAHYHLHNGYSDMLLQLENALIQTKGQRAYVGIYWGAVDSIAHSYGAHNRYTHTEIRTQLLALQNLLKNPNVQDGRTLFMLLADHGHYDAPQTINIQDDSIIREAMVFGLSGDARLPYLYLRPDTVEKIAQHIGQNYGDCLTTMTREAAFSSGFFGDKLSPKTASRVGDLILVPRLGWTVQDPTVIELPLISWHTGLSDWEMLIPFIWKML